MSIHNLHLHIPTPGDHYSPATGSAVMTIIYELTRQHLIHGGQSRILVKPGTRHDYSVGDCVEVPFGPAPSRNQKLLDAAMGGLGFSRPFGAGMYRAACDTIDPKSSAPVIVWNSPAPMRMLRKYLPSARLCLYAQNALFRTYTSMEARRTIAACDRIICCSQFIADDLTAKLGRSSEKIKAVVNGVDIERFCPTPSPPSDGLPVVLFVGRVIPEKGPDLLLHAARKVLTDKRQFKVRIIGSSGFSASDPLTPYERELRTIAEPIRDIVQFQPFMDRAQVLKEYQAASIFCVPSNWDEPVSLTVSEAMACGLPTIASRRGGIPEAGGDAVLYFKPPETDELAAHLENLLDNPTARHQWGQKARQQALTISWNNQYERLRMAIADQ